MEFIDIFLEYLPFISIPFISGIVGWGTNVLALKMTFYPLEYIGIRPFGWQGIVPSKAKKMATMSVDLMADKLINVKEIFARLDASEISKLMEPGINKLTKKIVNEIMEAQIPLIWKLAPQKYKQKIYSQINDEVPEITEKLMADIKEDVRELLDLKALAISVLMGDKALINKIFLKVGHTEFKFIEKSGFYFGFLFGLVQMIIFIFYNPWWVLPVAGIVVGYATNFLAMKMIFRPIEPVKFFRFTIQGLFFKRQNEVASVYSKIITDKILTVENLFDFIMRGPDTSEITKILHKHISILIDKIANSYGKILDFVNVEERLNIVKNIAVYRIKEELPVEISPIYEYSENTMGLCETMRSKMSALSSPEFENFLHPVFEEDELKLIIVGAVLGGLAGLAQYFLFFY